MSSTVNQAIRYFMDNGLLWVIDGKVFSKRGERKVCYRNSRNYTALTVSVAFNNIVTGLTVARLVAYKKYGNKALEKGIQVRHLDGDSTNNLENNIAIGTPSQNMMDIPKERRIRNAKIASSYLRKFTNEEENEIREFHNQCKSYTKTKGKYNISSSGSLWYILNKPKGY